MNLIDSLILQGHLKTPRIIGAFRAVKREDFVPEEIKYQADLDVPLPIGWGQTISQPLTVAFMMELLQPEEGNKILDAGAGSGWVTALLAYIVSGGFKPKFQNGRVYAVEIVPQLCEFGKENIAKYGFLKSGIAEYICGDATQIVSQLAARPELAEGFDKIHVAAAGEEIPQVWKDQLKIGGRMVVPIKSSIWLLIKKSQAEWEEKEYPGFAFVPLIK